MRSCVVPLYSNNKYVQDRNKKTEITYILYYFFIVYDTPSLACQHV